MIRAISWALALSIIAAIASGTPAPADTAATGARPHMQGIRVPDGSIAIDGRLDDWPAVAFDAPYGARAADTDHQAFTRPDRGTWLGPDDSSYTAVSAVDSTHIYFAAIVTDNILVNPGAADDPWVGDDFEVFIDASPPGERFQKGTNANFAQFIFVPVHVGKYGSGTFIWRSAQFPTVTAASRLTPTGYTIEVSIPTNIFPNWKTDPAVAETGFDLETGDLDSPGLFGHDPGPKATMFLMQPYAHFLSAEQLGLLQYDIEPTVTKHFGIKVDESEPGYRDAQRLLDHMDDADIGGSIKSALKRHDLSRKAALFALATRPELDADVKALRGVLTEPIGQTPDELSDPCRIFAMIALAERGKLPAHQTLADYGASDDLLLRHTALYCMGIDGDKSIVPDLAKLYPKYPDTHAQEIISVSLAELGDKTGVPSLEAYTYRDRGQWFANECQQLLLQLGISYTAH